VCGGGEGDYKGGGWAAAAIVKEGFEALQEDGRMLGEVGMWVVYVSGGGGMGQNLCKGGWRRDRKDGMAGWAAAGEGGGGKEPHAECRLA
jgi:hypothetical protein